MQMNFVLQKSQTFTAERLKQVNTIATPRQQIQYIDRINVHQMNRDQISILISNKQKLDNSRFKVKLDAITESVLKLIERRQVIQKAQEQNNKRRKAKDQTKNKRQETANMPSDEKKQKHLQVSQKPIMQRLLSYLPFINRINLPLHRASQSKMLQSFEENMLLQAVDHQYELLLRPEESNNCWPKKND